MSNARNEALSSIVEKAKNDAKFFHALVFNPEEALKGLDLDRKTKGAIVSANPDDLLRVIVTGGVNWCDVTCAGETCGVTCAGDSCGYTTNLELKNRVISRFTGKISWCDFTCGSSCGVTCAGASCGHTTNFEHNFREQIRW